jgi:hypothetical protein
MKRTKPNGKNNKFVESLVGLEPALASFARLFLYQNDDLYKLEVLASVKNDVAPDSPHRFLADLIERLVTGAPAKQDWEQITSFSILGPGRCTPAPGSPLYGLNKFLEWNPCILRIEGLERANGNIEISATHIPIPVPLIAGKDLGISDRAIGEWVKQTADADRILWLLWEVFYRRLDLTRLKECTVCHKWFVDHSKNKSKVRCSTACTSKRWSWEARKKTVGSRKAKGRKYAKAKKA